MPLLIRPDRILLQLREITCAGVPESIEARTIAAIATDSVGDHAAIQVLQNFQVRRCA